MPPSFFRSTVLSAGLLLGLPALFAAEPTPPAVQVAPPVSLTEALKVFRTTPAAPTDASALGAAAASLRDWESAQSNLSNLEGYFENNDFNNAINQARQYARQTRSPEVKKLWENLIEGMKTEQKKREAEINAALDSDLKKTAAALLTATKSADIDPIIDRLQTLQDSYGNNYTPRTQRGRNRLSNAISYCTQWQDLLATLEAGDTEGARNQLRNLASSGYSERLLSHSQVLARGLELKIGAADVTAEAAKVDAIVKRGAEIALTATKPAALDPIIEELAALKDARGGNYDSRLQRVYSRAENAGNFFAQWQDVLSSIEANEIDEARNQLRSLASNSYRYRPISRSDILARAASLKSTAPSPADEILKDATLDTLADYRDRLVFLNESSNGRRSAELSNAVSELDRLIAATAALKAGAAGDGRAALKGSATSCGAPNAGSLQGVLGNLKSQWFARALPELTGLKDLPAAKPDETTLSHVRRLFDEAAAAGDWPRAYRLVLVEKDMQPDTTPCALREQTTGANPAAAIGAWLKGQLLEKAAQPSAAAALYRDALKAGAPPALEGTLIGRLRELAVQYPDSAKEPR